MDNKRFLFLASLYFALSISSLPLLADTTSAQKDVTKKLTDKIHATPLTEKDYTDMCQRILSDTKAKRRMCELLLQDPEAMALLKLKK